MRTKIVVLLIATMAVFCTLWANGSGAKTHLVIEQLSGNDKQYAIDLIGQVRFTNYDMFLYDKSGTELGRTHLKDIGKIVFQNNADINPQTSVQNMQNCSILVYPNPTKDLLIINGLQPNTTVRIYNLQGQLLTATAVNEESSEVYVGNLQHGTYLLQVGAEIVKIIKQ